jgi:hypothetical protein
MNNKFIENADKLLKETEEWKKTWNHKNPCNDWKANENLYGEGFCKHYVNARYRKFRNKIMPLFEMG